MQQVFLPNSSHHLVEMFLVAAAVYTDLLTLSTDLVSVYPLFMVVIIVFSVDICLCHKERLPSWLSLINVLVQRGNS